MKTSQIPPVGADLYGDLYEPAQPAPRGWKSLAPGLIVAGTVALAAAWLSEHYGVPVMLMGLLLGLAFNFTNSDQRLHSGLGFASRSLLRWGIVLTGLQITAAQILGLGWEGLFWIAATIGLVTLAGALTARALGYGAALGTLAGGAVAICGASAALALATVLGERRATQAQLTLVLVTVSAASATAMSVYPALAQLAGLTDHQAGWMMGASIHDVAQALGAGFSISEDAGETATIVKLTRVAMLAPVLGIIAWTFPPSPDQSRQNPEFPWFVLGFLALALVASFAPVPPVLADGAKQAARACLLLAVTATGIRSPLTLMMAQGWRATMPVVVATVVAGVLGFVGAALIAS